MITTDCCIAGGGPAGMMLGLLLARAGVDVVVLEKHADFLRDFRGDTIHPSTLEVMHELGLLDEFLELPHQKLTELQAQVGETSITMADFSHLPTRCRFIALMPQWDFLNFLAERGARYPGFRLLMQTEATDLITEADQVVGVQARGPDGPMEIRAALTVGADGRHSTLRQPAGLAVEDLGAPMDVLWLRLSRRASDPDQTMGRIGAGTMFVMLNRGDYWQCAMVIPKGTVEEIRQRGLDAFRATIVELAPFTADRVDEIGSWDDVKPLTVLVDRLSQWWRPGLLFIGDAAHAMSPIGGVGINLAIQDAVAAANILAEPLRCKSASADHLRAVQRRRMLPTRITQRLQLIIQDRVIRRVLASTAPALPWPMALIGRWPFLQRLPARLVGLGIRREHVRTSELVGPLDMGPAST